MSETIGPSTDSFVSSKKVLQQASLLKSLYYRSCKLFMGGITFSLKSCDILMKKPYIAVTHTEE